MFRYFLILLSASFLSGCYVDMTKDHDEHLNERELNTLLVGLEAEHERTLRAHKELLSDIFSSDQFNHSDFYFKNKAMKLNNDRRDAFMRRNKHFRLKYKGILKERSLNKQNTGTDNEQNQETENTNNGY